MDNQFTHVVVGGGLAGGLVALALAEGGRGARIALVEAGTILGGNHTWSCHASDLNPDATALIRPLIAHHWPAHEVRFPDGERVVEGTYLTVTAARFHDVVARRLAAAGATVVLGAQARDVGARQVRLLDGRVLRGQTVIDARGVGSSGRGGWQKFLGLEVELTADLPAATRPILMDATVAQRDGFRFVYTLPLGGRRLLVEDTYYSDGATLDHEACRVRALAYLAAHGLRAARVIREERGVLPLPFDAPPSPDPDGPLAVGYRGGFFHPTTGYSLALAARVAAVLAQAPDREAALAALAELRRTLAPQMRFARLLNRLMFRSVAPEARWTVFARFYRLPPPLIARFYAATTTTTDRLRVLCGRPPRGLRLPRALSAEAPS